MPEDKVYFVWSTNTQTETLVFIGVGIIAILCWLGFFDRLLPQKEKKLEKIKENLVKTKLKGDGKTLSAEEQLFYDRVIQYEHEMKEAQTHYQVAKENLFKKQEQFEALLYAEKKRREGNGPKSTK